MPIFQCEAYNVKGIKKKLFLLGETHQEILEELADSGLFSYKIQQVKAMPQLKKVERSALLSFTEELYQLLKSKIPLYEAIKSIHNKEQNQNMQVLLIGILDKMKQGHRLSQILSGYPQVFDSIYLSMIQAGESSGRLELSLGALRNILRKELDIKKKVSALLAYPKFLLLLSFVLIIGVLVFLVPSFKELLEDREFKGVTRVVFYFSDLLLHHPMAMITAVSFIFGSLFLILKTKWAKEQLMIAQVKRFGFKNFYIPWMYTRFSWVTKELIAAHVPLLEAISCAKKVLGNPLMEKQWDHVIEQMAQGEKLSFILKRSIWIPDLVGNMVASREEIGGLEDAFFSLHHHYEEQMEKNLQQLTTFIQPALFIFLGLVIGIVLLSVLLPLTDTSNFRF